MKGFHNFRPAGQLQQHIGLHIAPTHRARTIGQYKEYNGSTSKKVRYLTYSKISMFKGIHHISTLLDILIIGRRIALDCFKSMTIPYNEVFRWMDCILISTHDIYLTILKTNKLNQQLNCWMVTAIFVFFLMIYIIHHSCLMIYSLYHTLGMPDSSCRMICVLRAIRALNTEGRARASSKALVWSD